MRLILTMIVSLTVCLPDAVATGGDNLFDALAGKIGASYVEIAYAYSSTLSGVPVYGEGQLQLQGTSYRHESSGLEVICDGESVWISDKLSKEMVIETAGDSSLPADPATMLVNLATAFKIKDIKKTGEGSYEYLILPVNSIGIRECRLTISGSSASPKLENASFTTSDAVVFNISIKSMTFSAQLRQASFFKPEERTSSWVVTDLR